jgi:gamma-glutamylputrescine oxidase
MSPLITSTIADLTYYASRSPLPSAFEPLRGLAYADVAIVGGGLAGLSAALQLAGGGYRVALLEAHRMGGGASGRNGGQALPGIAASQARLRAHAGADAARAIWEMSLEGLDLLRRQITRLQIDCDWREGHMHVADRPRQIAELNTWQRELNDDYDYDSLRMIERDELTRLIGSSRYHAALFDSRAGHLDPLAYTRGLAAAAARVGVHLHENSPALRYDHSDAQRLRVQTADGELRCQHLLLAGNASLGDLAPQLRRKIMGVGTYMIATEPLGEERAQQLIANNASVSDMNWILDYFRRSADHRLLFGGRVSYGGLTTPGNDAATRARMVRVFPQLKDVRIDYSWGGLLDITMNRMPHFGQLAPNVWFLQGFSGQGLALTGIAGVLAAEAISGTAERFDVFARLRHRNFPGGKLLARPLLALAMTWYRLRDLL